MTKLQLEKFILYLQKNDWLIFGPTATAEEEIETEEISPYLSAHQNSQPKTGQVNIRQIENPDELILDNRLPFYSFKRFFVPEQETLFKYKNNKLVETKRTPKIALLGINLLDLKAVNLYDQVFEKDPYYQARRRNILVVGHSAAPDPSTGSGQDNIFQDKFEENILEHLPFDIFLAENNPSQPPLNLRGGAPPLKLRGGWGELKVFTGSIKGQRILEDFGYADYTHIQFSGPVQEGKLDEKMIILRDKLEDSHNPKIWEELGKICIECGKCTIACPTCFCFRIDDQPQATAQTGVRQRCWDSCYYQEFSEVAGQHKFLNSTASRIHFWYFHKFNRIPREFDMMGCVGCHRCAKVCPVGIDIREVLQQIENS